jgi:nucleotide-binding universal stress UspA family protein
MAGRIVVGVDGSAPSKAALRWAAEEAKLRGARVEAVHVWTYIPPGALSDPTLATLPGAGIDPIQSLDVVRDGAEAELEATLADAFPEGTPEVVEPRLVDGDPSLALEDASKSADLLVVGHKGRSRIAAALLGSVAKHAVDRAHCPVVVVKAPDED